MLREVARRFIFKSATTFPGRKQWTREPDDYTLTDDKIEIITQPGTDLWQRTYYHFRNDNAPVLQIETEERFFSFIVKTDFILDDDRRKNAELFEEAFYEKKNLDPQMHVQQENNNATVADEIDPELLAKVLANPEMRALLNSLAKTMK